MKSEDECLTGYRIKCKEVLVVQNKYLKKKVILVDSGGIPSTSLRINSPFCGLEEIRTPDPCYAKAVLYH